MPTMVSDAAGNSRRTRDRLGVFNLQGSLRARCDWVQKALEANLDSVRGRLVLIALAKIADEKGRCSVDEKLVRMPPEISTGEFWVFVRMLENKGFLCRDGAFLILVM